MKTSPRKVNAFLLFKLPSAYLCGVRLKAISEKDCTTTVKYSWINQNPFNSLFWAVQGMAAELSTGALVMSLIKESELSISMLVVNNKATFTKKAKGRIHFVCSDGLKIKKSITTCIETSEGQTCWMRAEGFDESGASVSVFEFEWALKLKNN